MEAAVYMNTYKWTECTKIADITMLDPLISLNDACVHIMSPTWSAEC